MAHWLQLGGEEMNSRRRGIAIAVLGAFLMLALFGCSEDAATDDQGALIEKEAASNEKTEASIATEPETYLMVDGEKFSDVFTLMEIEQGNELAAKDYLGKEITIVSNVTTVGDSSEGRFIEVSEDDKSRKPGYENGVIVIAGALVDIPDSAVDLAKTLRSGDLVKVTGTVDGFTGFGEVIILSDESPFKTGDAPTTVEKVE